VRVDVIVECHPVKNVTRSRGATATSSRTIRGAGRR